MKNSIIAILSGLLIVGCTSSPNSSNNGTNLPAVSGIPSGQIFVRAKAEFYVSSSAGSEVTSSRLLKKSFVTTSCSHGACTDFTDVSVLNNDSTQFSLVPSQSQQSESPINTSNQNLSNILNLQIGTLFDNDLYSCGGSKCTGATVSIYTTNDGGTNNGSGLYNSVTGQSIPLMVSAASGSSNAILAPLSNVPYVVSGAGIPLVIDSLVIPSSKQVISLITGDLADTKSPGFTLSANFSSAGQGSYHAHVMVEYDLIGNSNQVASGFPASVSVDSSHIPSVSPLNTCEGPITISSVDANNNIIATTAPVNVTFSSFGTNQTLSSSPPTNLSDNYGLPYLQVFSDSNCQTYIDLNDSTTVGTGGNPIPVIIPVGQSSVQVWVRGLFANNQATIQLNAFWSISSPYQFSNTGKNLTYNMQATSGALAWTSPNPTLIGGTNYGYVPFFNAPYNWMLLPYVDSNAVTVSSSDSNLISPYILPGSQAVMIPQIAPVYTNTSVNLTLSDGATTQVSTISLTPGPLALGPNPGYLQSLTINNSQTFAILGGVPPFTVSGTFNSGGFISSPQLVTTGSNPNDFVWNVSYTSGMEASDWVAAPDLITVTDSAGNSAGYNLYVQDPCGIDPGSSVCCNGNPSDPSCQQNNPQGPDCSNWNNDQFDCMDNSGPFGESCTWYDDGLGDGGGSCGD